MNARMEHPTGDEIAGGAAWVERVIASWRYPVVDTDWFRHQLAEVPGEATVAGGFVTNVLELVSDPTARQLLLGQLHLPDMPSKFRAAPLNHFLLIATHVAQHLGSGLRLSDDMPVLQQAIDRGMAASLIRATLPGFAGMNRAREILRLIARAFSGTLFSHLRLTVERGGTDHWLVRHEGEHNFLAHFHYEGAYMTVLGAPFGPASQVDFAWLQPATAQVTVWCAPA